MSCLRKLRSSMAITVGIGATMLCFASSAFGQANIVGPHQCLNECRLEVPLADPATRVELEFRERNQPDGMTYRLCNGSHCADDVPPGLE
jgi:hypothetical protein